MIFSVVVFALLCYLFTLVYLFKGLLSLKICGNQLRPQISIVVAAKNEQQCIGDCLEPLLKQDYPREKFEIIAVDDASSDDTLEILRSYAQKYQEISVYSLDNSVGGEGRKKHALEKGISQARGDILLFTDADCVPPAAWVQNIADCFAEDVGAVVGLSPVIDPSDSFLGKLVHMDSYVSALISAGGIGTGGFITCTGRNLAYRKNVYREAGGFEDILHSLSGDDDLLLHQIRKKTNWKISFSISSSAIVPSYQTKNLYQMISQKSRHISAGKYYPLKLKLFYALMHLIKLSSLILMLISLCYTEHLQISSIALLIILCSDYAFIRFGTGVLKWRNPGYFLSWEIFYAAYYWISGLFALFGRVRWVK